MSSYIDDITKNHAKPLAAAMKSVRELTLIDLGVMAKAYWQEASREYPTRFHTESLFIKLVNAEFQSWKA